MSNRNQGVIVNGLLLKVLASVGFGLVMGLPAAWANLELEALVAEAFANNPAVQAAQYEVSRAQAERDELRGFFDPQLNATASQSDYNAGYNQALLHAGVDAAILPGVYLGTRVEESYYSQLQGSTVTNVFGNNYNDLWQSLAGLRLGVPLLRDRGFLQWKLSDERAAKRHRMAQNHWRAVTQQCRHDVEQQYIAVLETVAQRYVAQAALNRVEKLLKEAQELVQLKIVPGYQLFAARSEVALRQESEAADQQACQTTQIRLLEILGASHPVRPVRASFDTLILWAESVELPPLYAEDTALKARGDYNEILDFIEVAEKEQAINQDNLRDDLSLNMETILQGEDPNDIIGTGRYLSEQNLGASIGLTWKRPWGYRTEKARMRAISATIDARHELLRQTAIRIRADLKVQHEQFMSAQDRLNLVAQAIVAARQALEAENERFCLGEGLSRFVLDAQKDLTDALKRQIIIAVELLRAYSNFMYASGYAGEF
ncbi:MAG: TolC family protein [Verrucomicrobia bacterium]|nr:TolC family protein [Verrucomicrobiota bacterium]MBU1735762.1 TolC family protein [Verrucomicrobiota bacterium]MBU1855582.1 TolC family protein [Verrucomicrobiota bacterium]